MKQTLAYILLIANLCSGIAFAWDSHPEAMVGHNSAAVGLLADNNHGNDDPHHDDHCCHGAAHLIGMIYVETALPVMVHHENGYFYALALPSLYIPPLLRPPIV